jgi:ferric-dicitrate binding protein FerR (iron transport regulator)
MEDNEYIRLITKHLSQEASPDEEASLQYWLEADPGHRREFDALKNIWETGGAIIHKGAFDKNGAWEKIDLQSRPQGRPRQTAIPFRLLSLRTLAAASIILVLCITAVWYYAGRPLPLQQVLATEDNLQLSLPDGSRVWLRKGAILRYPSRFEARLRQVQLRGEAFFQPASDPSRPFQVSTAHATIEDIGTTFLVRDEDSSDEVLVISGKVKFTDREDLSISQILSPGQKATILKNKLSLSGWGTPNVMSWKTGILEFRQTPLDQVVQDINNYYRTKLAVAPALQARAGEIKVTARFDHQPLNQVLDEIKLTTGLQIAREKDTLIFVL